MKVRQTFGGFEWTATVGAHEGSDNHPDFIRVEGPMLDRPAEYHRNLTERGNVGTEQEGLDAIRYTVDNIVLPLAIGRAA